MTDYCKDTLCVICCCGEESGPLSKVLTFNMHEQLQNIAVNDAKIMVRLQHACDAIAGDILYHSCCLLSHSTDEHKSRNQSEPEPSGYTRVYSDLARESKSLEKSWSCSSCVCLLGTLRGIVSYEQNRSPISFHRQT